MRIDKYLKVSRLIKRRTVGKDLAKDERVYVNGRLAKPSTEVKVADIIKITFGNREIEVRVSAIANQSKKSDEPLFEIISQTYQNENEVK